MKPGSMSRFVAQDRIAVGMRAKRLIRHIQSGHTQNIDFGDFCRLLAALGSASSESAEAISSSAIPGPSASSPCSHDEARPSRIRFVSSST